MSETVTFWTTSSSRASSLSIEGLWTWLGPVVWPARRRFVPGRNPTSGAECDQQARDQAVDHLVTAGRGGCRRGAVSGGLSLVLAARFRSGGTAAATVVTSPRSKGIQRRQRKDAVGAWEAFRKGISGEETAAQAAGEAMAGANGACQGVMPRKRPGFSRWRRGDCPKTPRKQCSISAEISQSDPLPIGPACCSVPAFGHFLCRRKGERYRLNEFLSFVFPSFCVITSSPRESVDRQPDTSSHRGSQ